MNPLTNVKNIGKLNETELARGIVNKKTSWREMYKDSAWIFIGGLAYGLTEGDVISVFSQYGEVVNINMVRDKKTGTTKGFCFLCYANQKSTILAVDNLNGIKLCNRTIRVDHVANYKPPKENEKDDEITKMLKTEGCAPRKIKVEPSSSDDERIENIRKRIKKEKTSPSQNEEFHGKQVYVKKESRWESENVYSKKTPKEPSDNDDRMRKEYSSKGEHYSSNETQRKRTHSPETSKYKDNSLYESKKGAHKKYSENANSDSKHLRKNIDVSTHRVTLDNKYKKQKRSEHEKEIVAQNVDGDAKSRKVMQDSSSSESSSDSSSESDSSSSSGSDSSSSSSGSNSDNSVVKKLRKKYGADKKLAKTQSKGWDTNNKNQSDSDGDNSVVEKLRKKYGDKQKTSKSHSRSHDKNNKNQSDTDSDNSVVEKMRKKYGYKEAKSETCHRSRDSSYKYESGSDIDNSVVEKLRNKYGDSDKKTRNVSSHDIAINKKRKSNDSDKSVVDKLKEKYSKPDSRLKSSVNDSRTGDNESFGKSYHKQASSSNRHIHRDYDRHHDRNEKMNKYSSYSNRSDFYRSDRRH